MGPKQSDVLKWDKSFYYLWKKKCHFDKKKNVGDLDKQFF
jgi:hypothetical protein